MQSVYAGTYSPAAMLGAVHITDEIDLTGIATVILALATAGLAWWTRRAVNQGGTEVERAHRPVLVPNRARVSVRDALAELRRCAGSQFDPAAVTAFEAALCDAEPPPIEPATQLHAGTETRSAATDSRRPGSAN
jgi:hypothetical protein